MNDIGTYPVDERGAVICFPLTRQVSRIRATAALLLAAPDIETSDICRHAVSEEIFGELEAMGMGEYEQDEAVGAFFTAVENEMLRIEYERVEADVLEL